MRTFTKPTKMIRNLFFIGGVLLIGSCDNIDKSSAANESEIETSQSGFDKALLIGSWKDNSPSALDFTLFEDGTARSDNMEALLFKNWKVDGSQITFTIESIGNRTSSTDETTYLIEKVSERELILNDGRAHLFQYTKVQ
ncbi:MAG TPA: lipocalin family protein [Chitinophagales bacterium]|nr:lipocalin family protein [Chitinophagales bacterium]